MKRNRLMFLFAIIFAGLAAWLANAWVQQQTNITDENKRSANTTLVVVAATDIGYGQEIETVHLRRVPWPNESLPEGWFGDLEELQGMIAKRDIATGEIVSKSRVAKHLEGSTLSALIPKNKRAMSVRVNDVVGVAGFLLPGNKVDIYGIKMNHNTNRARVDTILTNINVLAVDQDAKGKEGGPKVVRAVTVEVTPKEAKRLVQAMNEGKIQLALRNPNDIPVAKPVAKKVVKKAPVRTAKIAPKPVPKPDRITVIRGLDVDKVEPKLEEGK